MSEESIVARLKMKAGKRTFTEQEELVLAGWVMSRDLTNESTTTDSFREFVWEYFGKQLKSPFISKLMKRQHLSLKLVGNDLSSIPTRQAIEEAGNFLTCLENLILMNDVKLSQLKSMDKTYLKTSPPHKFVRHICPKGKSKSRKRTPQMGSVHEIYTTLCADGSKSPLLCVVIPQEIRQFRSV